MGPNLNVRGQGKGTAIVTSTVKRTPTHAVAQNALADISLHIHTVNCICKSYTGLLLVVHMYDT